MTMNQNYVNNFIYNLSNNDLRNENIDKESTVNNYFLAGRQNKPQ